MVFRVCRQLRIRDFTECSGDGRHRSLYQPDLQRPHRLQTLDSPHDMQGNVDQEFARNLRYSIFIPVARDWVKDGVLDFEKLPHGLCITENSEQACANFDSIVGHPVSNAPSSPGRSATSLKGNGKFELEKMVEKRKKLQQGDIVYFRLVPDGSAVESVSISGIWRESPRWMWNPKDYTPDLVDSPERLPMNKKRKLVTLAEKMFGWVDDTSQESEARQAEQTVPLPAYKGRVTFSHAISTKSLAEVELVHQDAQAKAKRYDFAPGEFRGYFPLKILASPKPPCPEFYLTGARSAKEIRNEFPKKVNAIKIRGWKYYVLSQRVMNSGASHPWMTADPGDQETLKQTRVTASRWVVSDHPATCCVRSGRP